VQSLTRPNGSVTTYQYDIVNRLTQMTTTLSGNTLTQYTYTYNAQDLRDTENFIEPLPRAGYNNELDNYTCNNVNELTTINNPGQKNLVYDASGNLVQGYTPAGYQFTAAYDSANHLTSFTYTDGNGAVNNTQYTYLGSLLLEKTQYLNGTKTSDTRYVFDGSQATQERDGNNNVVNEYTWGLGLPGGIGGLLQVAQGGNPYSYLYDGKGNVTALLNASGQPAAAYQYDPFGQPQTLLASVTQPMGFSTKAYDPQTGLSYYGYRFYSPSLGRWLTRDPLGETGGINLYAYVQNNPVNLLDPLGLWGFTIGFQGTGALFGFGITGGIYGNFAHDPSQLWYSGWSYSATVVLGGGAAGSVYGLSGGGDVSVNNACNVNQLNGAFGNAGRLGLGWFSVLGYVSPDAGVTGIGISYGPSFGYVGALAGATNTWTLFGGNW
jgi:RHS repeat-associated protein